MAFAFFIIFLIGFVRELDFAIFESKRIDRLSVKSFVLIIPAVPSRSTRSDAASRPKTSQAAHFDR